MLGLEIGFPRVGFLQFWITLALGFIVVVVFSLYLGLFVWYFGKALRPYLTARFRPDTGIIQEYDRENLTLKLANYKDGQFTELNDKKEPVHRAITAKSVLSINGVRTLLGWNVTTKLPEQYLTALKILVEMGYKSSHEIVSEIQENKLNPNSSIKGMDKFTFANFLELHNEMVSKYTVVVTPDDVLNFAEKYLDEHPRKSIIEKEKSKEKKNLAENKYAKYAFLIIALMVLAGIIFKGYILYKKYNP